MSKLSGKKSLKNLPEGLLEKQHSLPEIV